MRRWLRYAVLATVLGAGCGPVEYVNQVTREASSEVEAARAVRADKLAPYWYTLAVEYLHKAREEASYADFQAANRFGRRAEEAAVRAREVALEEAGKPGSQRVPPLGGPAAPPIDSAPPLGDDDEVPDALGDDDEVPDALDDDDEVPDALDDDEATP